jgi:hypothetical protein
MPADSFPLRPTTDALPRLRTLEHCVLLVNLMLRLEVVGVIGGLVAVQSCSNIPVFHLNLPSCMRRVGPLRLDQTPAQQPSRDAALPSRWSLWRVVLALVWLLSAHDRPGTARRESTARRTKPSLCTRCDRLGLPGLR